MGAQPGDAISNIIILFFLLWTVALFIIIFYCAVKRYRENKSKIIKMPLPEYRSSPFIVKTPVMYKVEYADVNDEEYDDAVVLDISEDETDIGGFAEYRRKQKVFSGEAW